MDCLLKRRQGCEDKKLSRQKQNRTKVHYSTHTKHIQRLTRHQDAGKREQNTDLRCQRDENLRRRSPPRRRGTGRVADERPQEAECCRPCGRQQPEHQQGRCARDAERKRIHDADIVPRNRAHNQVLQRSGRHASEPRCKGDAQTRREGGQMST